GRAAPHLAGIALRAVARGGGSGPPPQTETRVRGDLPGGAAGVDHGHPGAPPLLRPVALPVASAGGAHRVVSRLPRAARALRLVLPGRAPARPALSPGLRGGQDRA